MSCEDSRRSICRREDDRVTPHALPVGEGRKGLDWELPKSLALLSLHIRC